MDIEQIIALFSLQTGLRRATIKEYLEELKEAGVIDENGRYNIKRSDKADKQADQPASE